MEAQNQPAEKEKIEKLLRQTGNTPFLLEELEISLGENCFLSVKEIKELRRTAFSRLEEELLKPFRRKAQKEQEAHLEFGVQQKKEEQLGQHVQQEQEIYQGQESQQEQEIRPGEGVCQGQESQQGQLAQQGWEARKNQAYHPLLEVSVETTEQWSAVLEADDIRRIYVDSHMFGNTSEQAKAMMERVILDGKAAGKELYLSLPLIYRKDGRDFCNLLSEQWMRLGGDGLLVHNSNEFGYLKERFDASKLVLSPSMYIFNTESLEFFRKQGVQRFFAPVELNEKELRQLGISSFEVMAYGYLPLMVSAQCMKKTLNRCEKIKSQSDVAKPISLTDRYHKEFRVKSFCRECYSVLYNSVPLSLLKQKTSILQEAQALCLSFTFETFEETKKILNDFVGAFYRGERKECLDGEYTAGHFKRGVE